MATDTATTIDQHAVNRAKLIERLSTVAFERGYGPEDIARVPAREILASIVYGKPTHAETISDTTWACLVIRLGGQADSDPILSPAEVERTAEFERIIEDALARKDGK
jgi:hypothetical protein